MRSLFVAKTGRIVLGFRARRFVERRQAVSTFLGYHFETLLGAGQGAERGA